MPNTLTIKLKGIALVHQAGTYWNVYLPFDEDRHRVLFGFFEGDDDEPLNVAGNRIEIIARNSDGSAVGGATPGKNYAELIDLTANFAHKDGVYLKKDWREGTVFMSLSSGIYSATLTPDEYKLVKAGGGSEVLLGVVGSQGTFELVADEFVVEITGKKKMTFTNPTTIFIDNDCPKAQTGPFAPPTNEDFPMLYNSIVRDKGGSLAFNVKPVGPQIPELPCNNIKVSVLLGPEP
jgi:hypothetical protein